MNYTPFQISAPLGTINGPFMPGPRPLQYPNPFTDIASLAMPTTIEEALRWGEFIAMINGPYREALKRICAYCITDPEVVEGSDDVVTLGREDREQYRTAFSETFLGVKDAMFNIDLDILTYGNAFVSVQTKFDRYLMCQGKLRNGHNCGFQAPLSKVMEKDSGYDFSFDDFEFHAHCPICGYSGPWEPLDRYSNDIKDVYIKRWNVHDIEILYDSFSDEERIIWRIPDDYKNQVRKGIEHVISSAPIQVLDAIRNNENILFDPDVILHIREATLSGIRNRGWGIPRVINNFRQVWFYQVVTRYNESLAMDYIVPFRVISPPPSMGSEGKDPIFNTNLGKFTQRMKQMVLQRRRDPNAVFVSPYPIEYQSLGGDAAQFLPREMLEYGLDTLLTSTGIPTELYKGTLQVQSAPVALRLFESFWAGLIQSNNQILNFIAGRLNKLLGWKPVRAKFTRITHADDINRQVQKLQLAAQGMASKTTALESIGMSHHEELRRMMEEQRDEAEQQEAMQKNLETMGQLSEMVGGGPVMAAQMAQEAEAAAAQGGGAPPMGAPGTGMPVPGAQMPQGQAVPGGGAMAGAGMSPLLPGNGPIAQMLAQLKTLPTDTPEDMYNKAQTIANQIYPMPNRASALRQLKQQDPQIHALVKSIIDQMTSAAASQGIQQSRGQGGQPPM